MLVVCYLVNYVLLRRGFRPKGIKFYWPCSHRSLPLNNQMQLKNSKVFFRYSLSLNFQKIANRLRTDPDPNGTLMLEQRYSNVIS